MSHADSGKVVVAALAGNLLIALAKFVAWFFTGSASTLAEAVHSVADTGNQALLLLGMKRAKRPATEAHPFGFASEKFFWPFIVSVMLFTVGGSFAMYEGIQKILHGAHEHGGSPYWNYAVLGMSTVIEAASFRVAWREFKQLRGNRSVFKTLREAKDPSVAIVLLEDSAALSGLLIALVSVLLTNLTGIEALDGIGSVVIGLVLCTVAVFMALETHSLLIGESASAEDLARTKAAVEGTPGVHRVTQMLSMHLGPDDVLLALKVDFADDLGVRQLEEAIDEIERRVRAELPHMRRIFVEPDSDYDAGKDPELAAALRAASSPTGASS